MSVARGLCAALLTGAAIAGCTEVSTDPQVPLSLQFDSLPALAVVVGDTMRGGDLLPARVAVNAFNSAGGVVSDSQIRLIGIDSLSVKSFRVISGVRLVGTTENSTVRIVAQAGALQSQTQTFAVVPRPTGIGRFDADSADSVQYDRPDTTTRFKDVRIALFAGPTFLNGLRVRFRIVSFTDSLLDSVRIVSPTSGRTITSQLTASDAATVRLKVYAKPSRGGRGVITVEATSRALGVDVPGSPKQFSIRLVPFTLPR